MKDTIEHKCTVSWGMVVGEDVGVYIDKLIEDKKKEVREAFYRIGYEVIDQHFIHDCEWGTLVTWAELVQPFNGFYSVGGKEIKFGYFYEKDKQLEFLRTK